jgi:hypothetical protein
MNSQHGLVGAIHNLCSHDSWLRLTGIERSSDNEPPMFQDYGRFGDLMSATDPVKRGHRNSSGLRGSQRARDTRTPSLISFVGQTGAGKSTLIKLLIDLNSEDTVSSRTTSEIVAFPTPVIGATGGHLPTSEDVHLYLDPSTAHSPSPILFADCEGLNGGERDPTGARMKKRRKHEEAMDGHKGRGTGAIKAISEQELTWADSPRTRTREYAVVNLYPRLLYTFSDVIIFVLTTPRLDNISAVNRSRCLLTKSQSYRERFRESGNVGSSRYRNVFQSTCSPSRNNCTECF